MVKLDLKTHSLMVQRSITDTQFGYRDLEEYEVAGDMFAKIFALHIAIDIIRNFALRIRR